jgi:hypothetical protein
MGVSVIGRPNIRDCVYSSTASKPVAFNSTSFPDRYMYFRNTSIVDAFATASYWSSATSYTRYQPIRLNNNEMYEANYDNTNISQDNANFNLYWNKVYFSSTVKCINTN